MKKFVQYRSNTSIRGVLLWAVLTCASKSVDDSKPCPHHDSDSMVLVLPVIAGVHPGHTDLSIWEKHVWGGVVSPCDLCLRLKGAVDHVPSLNQRPRLTAG